MTVAPATSQKRIDADRRNAQKSAGPRTPEGKNRSRFNGLKHGLTAKVPVIPGEDAAVYQERLDALIETCAPQNQVELELLGRLAATTWSLDRAARAEAAQIALRVRNYAVERERHEEEEAVAFGQRLFWDARGPWQLYPHHPHTGRSWDMRTSWSEDPADGNNPALLVLRLERTVAGCRWLLDRWSELRARLEPGEVWAASDQFKAIRLLGKQPLDAVHDSDVTLICLASAKLLPDGDDTKAFALVKHELFDGRDEPQTYSKELRKRPLAKLRPADAGAAREALLALVDRQTARLTLILVCNQELAEADAAEAPDRLAFDPSPEGEKLRRYVHSAARLANQTIKQFLSVVRCPLSVETETSGAGLENVGDNDYSLDWAYASPFAKRSATIGEAFVAEAAETGAAFGQRGATISAGEAAPEDLRSEPNTPTAMVQPVASFNPEPLRHGGPAPLRTEPITPPAEPEPGPMESPTSGSPDSPLAPVERGPDSMSGVRGLERDSEEPATPPLRSEPITPQEGYRPKSSLTPEPTPRERREIERAEFAKLNRYRAMLHVMLPPSALRKLTRSERAEVNKYRKELESMDLPISWSDLLTPADRAELDAEEEESQPTASRAPHPPPGSAAIVDPTICCAADSGPFNVIDRRYFGAKMTAAPAALAETEGASETKPPRSSSQKASKARRQH
jgi:hypothetical protein